MNKQNRRLVGSASSSFCIAIDIFPSPYVILSEATRVQEKSENDDVIIPVPYTKLLITAAYVVCGKLTFSVMSVFTGDGVAAADLRRRPLPGSKFVRFHAVF